MTQLTFNFSAPAVNEAIQTLATKNAEKDPNTMIFKIEDIDYQTAYNAHAGTSFSPEKRAVQEQQMFSGEMQRIFNDFKEKISEDKIEDLISEMQYFQSKYIEKYSDILYSRSRCLSSMITGPANFPTARNNKRNEVVHNKQTKFYEWKEKALDSIRKRLGLTYTNAISSDDSDAIEKLQKKLTQLEELQERMKATNKIVRNKKLDTKAKIEALKELGYSSDKEILKVCNPDCMGTIGFASFTLSNNNAKIRNTKARIAQLKRMRSEETTEKRIDGLTIVDNVEANRLQLFFDEIPPKDFRKLMGSYGFRFSKKNNNAWQAFRTIPKWKFKDILEAYNKTLQEQD